MAHAESVAFFPYPRLFTSHEEEYMRIFRDVLSRGAYILQRDLERFEEQLATYLGVKHAIGVADCTNGLVIGLQTVGIGPGDEVIFPSHTFVASAGAIKHVGATPVPCDIRLDDGMMDPGDIERHVTPHTKAIMPVQLNGRTCEMDRIGAIARKHGLMIVEDSAQALGSSFKGQMAGTFGRFGTFSFYPAKTLGCFGDGGAVVTDDDDLAENVRARRDHGRLGTPDPILWGGNCRLDNVQAAVLSFQMEYYPETIERRREIARTYHEAFSGIEDLSLPPGPDQENTHFDIFQNYELQANNRDELREYLTARNIGSMVQWGGKAVHQFDKLGFKANLPNVESYFERCFLLPMNSLMTDEEVATVCGTVREFFGLSS